jgi:hypothetical protein
MLQNSVRSSDRVSKRMRLEAYLSLGVGMIGMTASAEAGVVTIDVTTRGLTGYNGGLGVPGNGAFKYVPSLFPPGSPGSLGVFAWGYYAGNVSGLRGRTGLTLAVSGGLANPTVFALNAPIDSAATWSSDEKATSFNVPDTDGSEVKTPNFSNGFIGFRSEVNSNYYFGWLEVSWNNTAGYGGVFEILRGAYESTPNTLIFAGDTGSGGGAVPEPTSGAIAAMLLGGTALRQWRKKRRDSDSAAKECLVV